MPCHSHDYLCQGTSQQALASSGVDHLDKWGAPCRKKVCASKDRVTFVRNARERTPKAGMRTNHVISKFHSLSEVLRACYSKDDGRDGTDWVAQFGALEDVLLCRKQSLRWASSFMMGNTCKRQSMEGFKQRNLS